MREKKKNREQEEKVEVISISVILFIKHLSIIYNPTRGWGQGLTLSVCEFVCDLCWISHWFYSAAVLGHGKWLDGIGLGLVLNRSREKMLCVRYKRAETDMSRTLMMI